MSRILLGFLQRYSHQHMVGVFFLISAAHTVCFLSGFSVGNVLFQMSQIVHRFFTDVDPNVTRILAKSVLLSCAEN